MNDVLSSLPKHFQEKLIKKKPIEKPSPMLATLTPCYFSDKDWIFERKLDGERCLLSKQGRRVLLLSRNHQEQNDYYPEILDALNQLPGDFILDSELVTFDGHNTSFSKLQNRMHVKNPCDKLIRKYPVYAYVFDILYLDGYSLKELPLRKRKVILKQVFSFNKRSRIKYLPHRNEQGENYLKEAYSRHWEGVIAKKANSTYMQKRSKEWLKFKCSLGQEFVVGGYTKPARKRIGFGALLLGYYEQGELRFCGRVKTGFDDDFLEFLHQKMKSLEIKHCPFKQYTESENEITWVTPTLVVEVGFTEWTPNNKLRHPRFLGLRKDKEAKDVHLEGH